MRWWRRASRRSSSTLDSIYPSAHARRRDSPFRGTSIALSSTCNLTAIKTGCSTDIWLDAAHFVVSYLCVKGVSRHRRSLPAHGDWQGESSTPFQEPSRKIYTVSQDVTPRDPYLRSRAFRPWVQTRFSLNKNFCKTYSKLKKFSNRKWHQNYLKITKVSFGVKMTPNHTCVILR